MCPKWGDKNFNIKKERKKKIMCCAKKNPDAHVSQTNQSLRQQKLEQEQHEWSVHISVQIIKGCAPQT